MTNDNNDLATLALRDVAELVEEKLIKLLPKAVDLEQQVIDAMEYALLAGGKRVRPFLVMESSRICGVGESSALRVAAAVECAHTYSLIHDDLPCMDDDDMRRGQPSVHKKFDEATAVLAGDALLTLAFEILADEQTHANPRVRCELITALAKALGANGMVGGQMFDLLAENQDLDKIRITRLQRMKTGALIVFSGESGAILGMAEERRCQALRGYAHDVGLAFQIVDDLLDEEGDSDDLGKTAGKDSKAGKATFVSLAGVDAARTKAFMLTDQAIQHLDIFGDNAENLRNLAKFIINRAN
ncbi:polyprenyl synthetase family protein [Paremcibacter congregatus]|jgi:farnesyl diphosphate synthase|uniref:Farnesyl-diphosphate synthase n=1 Tax=Paremcibacter congregatus TaxID=2043170 RepID=A0A2G4YU40_9PROT|nr:farnesyl diphosphate synthase [Paremcibacter congregatus]PHZ85848.1 farnesyl-diphosphate synthase [Paremcibacter congregatus]QDE26811.1 polyprenyl synthetase family protein [Paremcibacter congregatus]